MKIKDLWKQEAKTDIQAFYGWKIVCSKQWCTCQHMNSKIERFNLSANILIWSNKYADMINRTDSTIWHPTHQNSFDIMSNTSPYTSMRDLLIDVDLKDTNLSHWKKKKKR